MSDRKRRSGCIRFVLVVFILLAIVSYFFHNPIRRALSAAGFNVPPLTFKYTFTGTFHDPSFPDVTFQATPIIPPKALSALPSDYVQVQVTIGQLTFSTDDPQYQCIQGLVPFLFDAELAYPGAFLAVFNNCGSIVSRGQAGLMMISHALIQDSSPNLYVMFTFPQNAVCSTNSSGQSKCLATPTTTTPTPAQRTLTSQQTQSQTVKATGQGTRPGTQATGMLRARNPYPGTSRGVDITYKAGTVFDDDAGTSPNVQMMIDATITVPGNGTSVTVPAHVVQIGTIGNISQISGWHNYSNGYASTGPPLDIDNSTPFTGGTDAQSYTTVQQSDIDTAANSLTASTRQSAVTDLNSQLRPNEHQVGDPQCTSNSTSDHAAGDQATTVTVTVKTSCTATAST